MSSEERAEKILDIAAFICSFLYPPILTAIIDFFLYISLNLHLLFFPFVTAIQFG